MFKPSLKSERVIDMRRELEKRKQFYLPSQLMKRNTEDGRKERRVPTKIMAFADMFYCGTDELAFGKKSNRRIGFVKREKSDTTSSVDVNVVEASAIADDTNHEKDPLDYVPELGPFEELDLPDMLPDLPGVAEDLLFSDYDIAPAFPNNPVLPEQVGMTQQTLQAIETVADISEKASEIIDDHQEMSSSNLKHQEIHNEVPVVREVKRSATLSLPESDRPPAPASTPVPAPPPAPPLPPPAPPLPPPSGSLLSTVSIPSGSSSSPANDRSDLMAAIRAAGGAGKAKLKRVGSSRRAHKEGGALGSSALTESKSSTGNDLMASLAKALEARRKAISGMSNPSEYGHRSLRENPYEKEEESDRATLGHITNTGDDEWN